MTGRDIRRAGRGAGLAAAPLAAVALGVFAHGGYSAGARVAFAVGAGVALLLVRERSALREPVVVVLLALAVLGALSSLWTLGPVDRTLRWALVAAGYAAVAVAAAGAARRRKGLEALAAGLALLAIAAGAAGLAAAVTFTEPYAEPIGGVWRPGGPFEYPPALALLEVSALPALLVGMTARSRPVSGAAAMGIAVAGGVLALSASRVALAMALALGALALAFPRRTAGCERRLVGAALGVGVCAAVLLQAFAGPPMSGAGADPARIATLIVVVGLAAPAWWAARWALERREGRRHAGAAPAWVAVALLVCAVLVGSVAFGSSAGRGAGAPSGFLHGRDDTWRAGVETFADRPLAGAGADAFLAGSARHQDGQTIVFAHDLPLELAAELGVAGLVLAIGLYLCTARLIWRARMARAAWLMGPAAAAFLIASLVDWPWHLAGAGAVWALAVGALARVEPTSPLGWPPPGDAGSRIVELQTQGDS